MWIVRLALRRPYTFVVMSLLILILGVLAIYTTPIDIFPNIDIPILSVVYGYPGLSAEDVSKADFRDRIFHPDDIERLRDYRDAAIAKGAPFQIEQRAVGKDGRYR